MAVPLSSIPLKFHAQIAAQWHPASKPTPSEVPTLSKPKRRIRQNSSGMNKTEQAFFEYLQHNIGRTFSVMAQCVTLRLANGVRYCPDFIVKGDNFAHAYEVKGFMRDDAAVKLKVAASLYPWIKFHLVTKRKCGGWDILEVLP